MGLDPWWCAESGRINTLELWWKYDPYVFTTDSPPIKHVSGSYLEYYDTYLFNLYTSSNSIYRKNVRFHVMCNLRFCDIHTATVCMCELWILWILYRIKICFHMIFRVNKNVCTIILSFYDHLFNRINITFK